MELHFRMILTRNWDGEAQAMANDERAATEMKRWRRRSQAKDAMGALRRNAGGETEDSDVGGDVESRFAAQAGGSCDSAQAALCRRA